MITLLRTVLLSFWVTGSQLSQCFAVRNSNFFHTKTNFLFWGFGAQKIDQNLFNKIIGIQIIIIKIKLMAEGGLNLPLVPQTLTWPIRRAPSLNQDAGAAGFRAAAATHSTPIFMTLHTLFSTVSYCSVLWFIICSTGRTKPENIGSEQKKNEEKQPIIFYLIAYLSHFAMYLSFYIQPIFLLFSHNSLSKLTNTFNSSLRSYLNKCPCNS